MPGLNELTPEHSISSRPTLERIALAALLLFTGFAIWSKWGKLNSLLLLDPAWWLNEYSRYARGELPYRDYYWPYGPLSADVFGWALRLFGVRFGVVQTVMDVLSIAVVAFVYAIARRLVPPPLGELTAMWLIAVGITASTFFTLFSLIGYTPAVQVAAAGLLLMMWAVFAYIADGHSRTIWVAIGAWVACLSKQETLLAAVVVFLLLAAFDRRLHFVGRPASDWLRRYLLLGFICFSVPVLIYIGWATSSGWSKFLACMQGFGLASIACPWWPTGFGVIGALVALGKACIVLAFASIFVPGWRARLAGWYWLVWLIALSAAVGAVAFEWRLYADFLFGRGSLLERVQREAIELLSTSSILRPVLWAGYVYGGAIVIAALRNSGMLTSVQLRDLILIAVPGVMSVRSLFGSIIALDALEVPAIAYPFLLLAGPYLLYSALTQSRTHNEAKWTINPGAIAFCAAILISYSIIRLVGGYQVLLSNTSFPTVETPAGRVRLKMSATEKPILDYILANTNPSQTILEMPFGGGMSFATARKQPTYSTLFIQLRPPQAIQQEDLRRFVANPPALVIAPEEPRLGTLYGCAGTQGCAFPGLVWQPNQPTSDPRYIFPIVDYIQRKYRVDRKIGEWILLRPIQDNGH
jgi:hypothetical protein